jgi:hypothetical protein
VALFTPVAPAHVSANDHSSIQLTAAFTLAVARALFVADGIALTAAERGTLARTEHATDDSDALTVAFARAELCAELHTVERPYGAADAGPNERHGIQLAAAVTVAIAFTVSRTQCISIAWSKFSALACAERVSGFSAAIAAADGDT